MDQKFVSKAELRPTDVIDLKDALRDADAAFFQSIAQLENIGQETHFEARLRRTAKRRKMNVLAYVAQVLLKK